jgi:hypothetical protein
LLLICPRFLLGGIDASDGGLIERNDESVMKMKWKLDMWKLKEQEGKTLVRTPITVFEGTLPENQIRKLGQYHLIAGASHHKPLSNGREKDWYHFRVINSEIT